MKNSKEDDKKVQDCINESQKSEELKLGESQDNFDNMNDNQDLVYGLHDKPPVRDSIFAALQHCSIYWQSLWE